MQTFFRAAALLFLCGIAAVLIWQDYRMFRRRRVRTDGSVVGHRTQEDEGSRYFSARVAFTDARGDRHEFTDTLGLGVASPEVGSKIAVVYPEDAPSFARVPRPWLRALVYLFVLGTGAALLLFSPP